MTAIKTKHRKLVLSVLFLPALLAGCMVGPSYTRPVAPAQSSWKEQAAPTSRNIVALAPQWWRIFADPDLDRLETQALDANQDLKRAIARVTEARALARITQADLYPIISGGSTYTRNRASASRVTAPGQKLEYDDFVTSLDLDYELDIWGRVRRGVEAARADAASTASEQKVVLLTLTSDLARNYYLLRSLDSERQILQATVALRRDALQLQQTRHQAGLINEVDVTRSRTELANVEAELQTVIRARAQTEHAIAVLCGQPAGNFAIATRDTAIPTPEVPPGLPSELLQRRPDIIQAEQHLAADSARIGVAKAAFFPTIKLTGAAGLASADLGTLVNWPSKVWSVGPSVHVPIFEGGRNRANLAVSEARYEQSIASYRATILNAFRQVEDSLSDSSSLAAQNEAIDRALLASRDTAILADERYRQGLSNYLDVVDAQRVALQAERQQAQIRGQRAVSTILLAKALGGGWTDETTPVH